MDEPKEEIKIEEPESTRIIKNSLEPLREILVLLGYEGSSGDEVLSYLAFGIETFALQAYFEALPPEARLEVEILNKKDAREYTQEDVDAMRNVFQKYQISMEDMQSYYAKATKEIVGNYLSSVMLVVGPVIQEKIRNIILNLETDGRS